MGFGFVLARFGLILEIIRLVPVHRHLVFFDGTATSKPPCHMVLYSNWRHHGAAGKGRQDKVGL